MAETLRADGIECDVVRVDTRDAFLHHLEDKAVDVIISDVTVPGFDGMTAQKAWREQRPGIPFIFLSGTPGEHVAIERLKAGATDYVLKDWVERLPAVVRRALRETEERVGHQQALEGLRMLTVELERRVDERTAQLKHAEEVMRVARKEAERANHAKSEFLSRMSHDLRTPLNAVLGFAQLLDMDNLTVDQRESVLQILKAGRHLLGLLNEVLDISRIETGHLSLSPEPVSVSDAIEQTVKQVRPLAATRRIEIDSPPEAGVGRYVQADRKRLNQVLLNFASNAIKYNRLGGRVTLSCDLAPGDRVRITVTDTGGGIRPEKLALLFRPFERLGADQAGIEGTGLGLALSRGLAEAMGGTVGVESEVDRGSAFWIELAGSAASNRPAYARPLSDRPEFADAVSGVVLYVEDNAANARLVERLLRQRRPGITLLHASEGELGIAMALHHQPDLIFLDLHLPDIHGEEVLRRLSADPQTRHIPVAVLSADAISSHSERLLAAGAAAYLTKPLDVARLLALLDERFLV